MRRFWSGISLQSRTSPEFLPPKSWRYKALPRKAQAGEAQDGLGRAVVIPAFPGSSCLEEKGKSSTDRLPEAPLPPVPVLLLRFPSHKVLPQVIVHSSLNILFKWPVCSKYLLSDLSTIRTFHEVKAGHFLETSSGLQNKLFPLN